MTEVRPEEHVSILVNPMPSVPVIESRNPVSASIGGTESPTGTESPGTSQMSPPPSYYDIPGKALTFLMGSLLFDCIWGKRQDFESYIL